MSNIRVYGVVSEAISKLICVHGLYLLRIECRELGIDIFDLPKQHTSDDLRQKIIDYFAEKAGEMPENGG